MTEIKKMRAYVDRTKIPNIEKYHLSSAQMDALIQMLHDEPFPQGILYEAFAYGLAKGYRAAKKEAKDTATAKSQQIPVLAIRMMSDERERELAQRKEAAV